MITKRDMLRLLETGFHIEYTTNPLRDEDIYMMEAVKLKYLFSHGIMATEDYVDHILSLMDVYGIGRDEE